MYLTVEYTHIYVCEFIKSEHRKDSQFAISGYLCTLYKANLIDQNVTTVMQAKICCCIIPYI